MKIDIPIGGHAWKRMEERGISETDVEAVVFNHTASWEDPKNGSRVLTGETPDGRVLRIALVDPPALDGTVIVKSVFEVNQEDSV